jgi:hypothetical protein
LKPHCRFPLAIVVFVRHYLKFIHVNQAHIFCGVLTIFIPTFWNITFAYGEMIIHYLFRALGVL